MKFTHRLTAIALSTATTAISLTPLTSIVLPIWQEDKAVAQLAEIAGPLTLGVVLQNALDRAETVVRTAGEAGRGIVVQAGTEAYMTIQSAKTAYKDSLDVTVDKLDASTTQKLQEIKSMMDDLQSKTDNQVEKAGKQAQQITNSLPLANTVPQLTSFSPKFVAKNTTPDQVEVEVKGNFIAAQNATSRPSLKLGNQVYEAAENTTQSLKFLIPMNANTLGSTSADPHVSGSQPAESDTTKIIVKKATLSIPYNETTLPGGVDQILPKAPKAATYDLLLSVLPANPGRIVFLKKVVHQRMEREHVKTQTWQQHSSNDDHKDVHYEGPPEDVEGMGWKIDPASVQFVTEWNQGNENDQWSKALERTNPSVVYKVTTIHHGIGTSGKVNFHFEYDRFRSVPEETWEEQAIPLNWGETKSLPANPNEWKVQFVAFDGQKQEIVGTDDKNPYLKVKVDGKNVVLTAPHPKDMKD
jgi:hypothetical protein